jgi:hypothetical protein
MWEKGKRRYMKNFCKKKKFNISLDDLSKNLKCGINKDSLLTPIYLYI